MIKRSGLPRGCTYEAELLIEWPNCAESITHLCPYSSPTQRKPDWQRWVGSRPGGLSQADQLGGWQLPARNGHCLPDTEAPARGQGSMYWCG